MAFWNRNRETRSDSGLSTPATWMLDAFGDSTSPSGKRVTTENVLGLAPVWSAISLISEQVGQLPLKVYKQVDGDRVEARSHRAWSLLHDKPNEHTPADRFWSAVTAQLLLYGNSFIVKHRDGMGLVDELTLLNPAHVVVYWDGDQRIKQYVYTPFNGEVRRYTTDEVLHIYGMSVDGVIGESVIHRCKAAFGAAMARDEYEGSFYKRGATLSGAIKHPGHLSDTAVRHLKESVAAIYGGSDKAHQVGVFEEGADFVVVGSPMRDLEFVASQQMTRTDIATMFKLPPNYLGGSSGDSLTYATVESNQIQFAQHAIAPWTNVIAKALTSDSSIFPQNVYDAEFVLDGMLRADAGARANFYKEMTAAGAMSVNEIRRLENLPPIPGGELPQIPTQQRISVSEQLPVDETTLTASAQNALPPGATPAPAPVGGSKPRPTALQRTQ